MEKLRGTELKCLYRQCDVPRWIHGPLLDGEKKLGQLRELDPGSQAGVLLWRRRFRCSERLR